MGSASSDGVSGSGVPGGGGFVSNPGSVVFTGATPKCAVTLTEKRANVDRKDTHSAIVSSYAFPKRRENIHKNEGRIQEIKT